MSERSRFGGPVAKALLPVVASLASALGAYAAKKGSRYLEETVLPKLRDSATPRPAQQDERPRTINDDLERRRRERAEHRAARREAS